MLKPFVIAAAVVLPLCVFAGNGASGPSQRGGGSMPVQAGGSHDGGQSFEQGSRGGNGGASRDDHGGSFSERSNGGEHRDDRRGFGGGDRDDRDHGIDGGHDLDPGKINCDPSDPVVPPTSPIPEPETASLMLAGLGALLIAARRRLPRQ